MLVCLSLLVAVLLLCAVPALAEPIRLHPDNPHYFLFRGKPTTLITSGEHYGAVLNLDFDYAKYIDTLQRDGMNNTRTFVGAYCEPDGAFNIARNSLAPAAGRFISPWARSEVPGYANGGPKFDLSRWSDAYFARLRDFVSRASAAGVVVEVNLFCPFYGDGQWNLSPMNARNNINGIGQVAREQVYTLDQHGGLLEVQEAMARKVIEELRDFDNIYYEVMNEPYARDVPMDWQDHMADVIVEAESGFEHRHLISYNIANGQAKVEAPHPGVSILNFHYAWPPNTVAMNYGLDRVIGDNETGFKGTGDAHYRREAWAFILSGGGLYNNLDYSFVAGHEDGTFAYPPTQPGGGGVSLRKQLGILRDFINTFDFINMRPAPDVIKDGLPKSVHAFALARPGRHYAIYLCRDEAPEKAGSVELRIDLPAGKYQVRWLNTLTGRVQAQQSLDHPGGVAPLASPEFDLDVALGLAIAHSDLQ